MKRYRNRLSKKGQLGLSGFTLLELMIALVILGFGLMGVALMVMTSVRGNAFGSRMTQATALAQGKIEELRNTSYVNLYANCGVAGFPDPCLSPPVNMPDASLNPNDSGVSGDDLTGGSGDGIWTYFYDNANNPLPTGMTLVWGVRRNYPQPRLIWLMAVVQWEEGKATTNTKEYTNCIADKTNPIQTTDSTYRVCIESVLGNF